MYLIVIAAALVLFIPFRIVPLVRNFTASEVHAAVDPDAIKGLRVNSVEAAIIVKPAIDRGISFEITGRNAGSYTLDVDRKGDYAEVSIERRRFTGFLFSGTPVLEISLPPGSIELAELKTVSGRIILEEPDIPHLQAATVSGSISTTGGRTESYDLRSTSGRIRLESVSARGTLRTVSGRIETEVEQLVGDLSFTTVSGRMTAVFQDTNPFRYDLKTVTGNIRNERSHESDGAYLVTMKSTSGTITLQ